MRQWTPEELDALEREARERGFFSADQSLRREPTLAERLEIENAAQAVRIAALEAALERYGGHDAGCPSTQGGHSDDACACGYRAALPPPPAEKET